MDGATILDVGSGSSGIAPLIPAPWRVTAVDSSFDDYGTARGPADDSAMRLVADACDLPFEDAAFDVVTSVDLLEHLTGVDRRHAMTEMIRVARRRVILACPIGEEALFADRRLADFYRNRATPLPGWLAEHLAGDFPEAEALVAGLRPFGPVRLFRNESVKAHERLMRFEAGRLGMVLSPRVAPFLGGPAGSRGKALRVRRAMILLLRGFDRAPSYRTIAVADRA